MIEFGTGKPYDVVLTWSHRSGHSQLLSCFLTQCITEPQLHALIFSMSTGQTITTHSCESGCTYYLCPTTAEIGIQPSRCVQSSRCVQYAASNHNHMS